VTEGAVAGGTRGDFLAAARAAVGLLRAPEVAAAWARPSALPEFTVSGLAGHLAYQVLAIPGALGGPEPQDEPIPLLEHYARVQWIGAGVDDEINVGIRRGGEDVAAEGPDALADCTEASIRHLAAVLASVPDRTVRIPWVPWSLRLDDFLVTRMMELAVHSDDLAVSVGVATPPLPQGAVDAVVDLLSRLAVRRHGPTAVLRALSRAERAPATIAAI
jgi:Mycothiol maleylpyruvate isomerase N-terminal domain